MSKQSLLSWAKKKTKTTELAVEIFVTDDASTSESTIEPALVSTLQLDLGIEKTQSEITNSNIACVNEPAIVPLSSDVEKLDNEGDEQTSNKNKRNSCHLTTKREALKKKGKLNQRNESRKTKRSEPYKQKFRDNG